MTEAEEVELGERDERVRNQLTAFLENQRALARSLREQASEAEESARFIERAVQAGEWWKLGSLIEQADINSLCEAEPCPPASILE